MTRQMLRAKIHRIAVTERNVEYEGSLTLDAGLMRAARSEAVREAGGLRRHQRQPLRDLRDRGDRGGRRTAASTGRPPVSWRSGDKLILAAYAGVARERAAQRLAAEGPRHGRGQPSPRDQAADEGAGVRVD